MMEMVPVLVPDHRPMHWHDRVDQLLRSYGHHHTKEDEQEALTCTTTAVR